MFLLEALWSCSISCFDTGIFAVSGCARQLSDNFCGHRAPPKSDYSQNKDLELHQIDFWCDSSLLNTFYPIFCRLSVIAESREEAITRLSDTYYLRQVQLVTPHLFGLPIKPFGYPAYLETTLVSNTSFPGNWTVNSSKWPKHIEWFLAFFFRIDTGIQN